MVYDQSWDCPHPAGESDRWQESDCYWFFDVEQRIGGYWRVGQYLNQGVGQAFCFMFKEGGQRFALFRDYQGDDCSCTDNSQTVGSMSAESLGDGRMKYAWDESDCDGELEFYNPYYTPRSWSKDVEEGKAGATIHETMNTGGHLEVAGKLKGRIRLGNGEYNINTLAHRDRSWGARDYNRAWQHRMVTGTIGEELSWVAMVVQMANGAVLPMGFVAEHGETTDIKDLKVITEYDYDGATVASVRMKMALEDNRQLVIKGSAAQGYVSKPEGILVCTHTLMDVEYNGKKGFTVLDSTNAPRKGTYLPSQEDLSLALTDEGLSDSADYADLRW